jgi:hypothetical protein
LLRLERELRSGGLHCGRPPFQGFSQGNRVLQQPRFPSRFQVLQLWGFMSKRIRPAPPFRLHQLRTAPEQQRLVLLWCARRVQKGR